MRKKKFKKSHSVGGKERCEDTLNGVRCVLINTHEGPHANYDTLWAYFKDGSPSVGKMTLSNPEEYIEIP